jgi:hypothetical protein
VKELNAEVKKGLTAAQQDIFNQVIPEAQEVLQQLRERFITIGRNFLKKMALQAMRTMG